MAVLLGPGYIQKVEAQRVRLRLKKKQLSDLLGIEDTSYSRLLRDKTAGPDLKIKLDDFINDKLVPGQVIPTSPLQILPTTNPIATDKLKASIVSSYDEMSVDQAIAWKEIGAILKTVRSPEKLKDMVSFTAEMTDRLDEISDAEHRKNYRAKRAEWEAREKAAALHHDTDKNKSVPHLMGNAAKSVMTGLLVTWVPYMIALLTGNYDPALSPYGMLGFLVGSIGNAVACHFQNWYA